MSGCDHLDGSEMSSRSERKDGGVTRSMRAIIPTVVLALASVGCGGSSNESADPVTTDTVDALEVTGTDQLAFVPNELTAEAGEINVALTSEPGIAHDFVIEDGERVVASAGAGETAVGSITLDSGTYTFYCGVPGHREAGMVGTLEVTD